MSNTITIYRREDANTTPRGFGNPPTYHVDEPYHSDADMIWVTPVLISLPDGWEIAQSESGTHVLYDDKGEYQQIVDDHGHPAIITGVGANKEGKPFTRYQRLDK